MFISVNMKCYWTVNSSYWPPLRISQYEVNTSWPPQQKSIVLQYWKPKINSFSYAEKKIMAYVHQLLDQPSQWQTSKQAGLCSVPKFTNTSITVKHLLIKNKNINQSKSSLLIWHYVSYLFLLYLLYQQSGFLNYLTKSWLHRLKWAINGIDNMPLISCIIWWFCCGCNTNWDNGNYGLSFLKRLKECSELEFLQL